MFTTRLANALFAFAGYFVICGALLEFRGEQEWYSTRFLDLTTGGLTVAVFAYLGPRPARNLGLSSRTESGRTRRA